MVKFDYVKKKVTISQSENFIMIINVRDSDYIKKRSLW